MEKELVVIRSFSSAAADLALRVFHIGIISMSPHYSGSSDLLVPYTESHFQLLLEWSVGLRLCRYAMIPNDVFTSLGPLYRFRL